MKNNNLNIIFKTIALSFFLQPCLLKPIQIPSFLVSLNKENGEEYIENCKKISQYVNKIGIFFYYCTTKNNIDKTINFIQNQLTEFETQLLTAEQEALLAIKKKYHISDRIWQKYLADMHRMKTIYTKSMTQSNPETIHDPDIPADILEIVTTLLQKNDINPHSIHLKMVSNQKKINKYPNRIAQTYTQILFTEVSGDNLISYRYHPPTIEFFPIMLEHSIIEKIATCAHEIQHLIQHHVLTDTLLRKYLEHYYNIDIAEFEKTAEYHKLAQIHEAQAEILAAIKNPTIAQYLKTMREKSYYPDHLYEDHFFHLASINTLWQVHTWIKSVQQDGIKQTINGLKKLNCA